VSGEAGTGEDVASEVTGRPVIHDGRPEPGTAHIVGTIVRRELRTVARTRSFLLLGAALTAVLLGVGWLGGGLRSGYVPTAVDLLTPLELLVPVVAVAFGYRAVLGDQRRGELDVLRTYPVASWQIVAGVYVGRAVGLVVAVLAPLAVVGGAVAVVEHDTAIIYATHAGADSPLLYARMVVLTVLFALVVLAVAIAISAVASATRSALALAVVALVVLLVGADLALVYGLSAGILGDGSLIHALALSPLSAYRGLVLETAVVVAAGTGPQTAAPLSSLLGLALWWLASLSIAAYGVERA